MKYLPEKPDREKDYQGVGKNPLVEFFKNKPRCGKNGNTYNKVVNKNGSSTR